MELYHIISLCFLVIFTPKNCCGKFVNVTTPSGSVRGLVNNEVSVFTAIPYGEPPVGNLRFQKPQKMEPWQEVFDATKQGNICVQFVNMNKMPPDMRARLLNTTQSEDCLNLDVYVPRDLSAGASDSEELLPVLVFIHGGAFKQGSRVDYNGTLLAKRGNMIVVTVNYRLGVLGFLALDHEDLPANVGLMDQSLALEWVRDNIRPFGGNPEKVTLYGESAGSFCVSAHILTPSSKGLFHGAIMNSGVLSNDWIEKQIAAEDTYTVGNTMGCDLSSPTTVLLCLRNSDIKALNDSFNARKFKPFLDGKFIPDQPTKLIASGEFNRVPIMTGFNSEDGSILLITYKPEMLKSGIPEHSLNEFMFDRMRYSRPDLTFRHSNVAYALAETYYFSNRSDPLINLRAALDFCRDIYWSAPAVKLAKLLGKAGVPVYLYEFDEKRLSNPFRAAVPTAAAHGDDLAFVFGFIEDPIAYPLDYTSEKLQFVKDLMATWSDFIHTGKPSLRTTSGGTLEWKPFTETDPSYAVLKVDVTTIKSNPAPLADNVWNKMLGSMKAPTPCPSAEPSDSDPIVVTESGQIKGVRHKNKFGGIVVETFFGVPYAAPPTRELRFRRTRPVEPWPGTLDATNFADVCPQDISYLDLEINLGNYKPPKMSEDCLHLNVWVPGGVAAAKNVPMPILLYIHGGAYVIGNNRLNMVGLASIGDVIVISVQYRLGLLGFLTTGNSTAPGNLALWDLLEALNWVKVNAGFFGGDIDRVTVGGHSAGASLSTLLMLSPRVRGFFQNVFAMSGSGISSWAMERQPRRSFEYIIKNTDCSTRNTDEEKVECLRQLPFESLLKVTQSASYLGWMPYVDGVMFPDQPRQLKYQSHLQETNFLAGTILTEGPWIGGKPPKGISYKDYTKFAMNALYPNSPAVGLAVVEFYGMNGTGDTKKYADFVRDEFFVYGIESLAMAITKSGSKAYIYAARFNPPGRPRGAIHGDELPLFSGLPLMNYIDSNFTTEQIALSRNWVTYISNFFYTGNPNTHIQVPVDWPAYDLQTRSHIILSEDMNVNSVQYSQRRRYVDFLDEVVPMLVNTPDHCITPDNIAQASFTSVSKNRVIPGILESCPSSKSSRTGLFNARRDEIDAAVIGLMAASGFLLLLVIVLIIALCKRSSGSSLKSYEFKNGMSF